MSHQANLKWDVDPDAVSYNVYKGVNGAAEGAQPINTAPVTTNSFVDTNVTAGEKVEYSVTAVSASGVESAHSAEVTATVGLSAPTGLAVTTT